MGCYDDSLCRRINTLAAEAEAYMDLLYSAPCIYIGNMLLYQLKAKVSELYFLSGLLCPQLGQKPPNPPEAPYPENHVQKDFTQQQLAEFDGKDGNPAYVAVNGKVYDVTGNAAWAAASHFGLRAGRDLTGEFASCHKGQPILDKLKLVGKLV